MPKLTKRIIEGITPDPHKQLKLWDTEIKGFGVIILPSGQRTYCVDYRNTDRIQKRLKLGIHGHITVDQARILAKKHFSQVAEGKDPAAEKLKSIQAPTFSDLCDSYIEKHLPQKRAKSQHNDKLLMNNLLLPEFSKRKLKSITHLDIHTLHRKLKAIPYQANRTVALLSKMFSLAVAWSWIDKNPASGIQKYQEEKRTRWLDNAELERFWAALNQYTLHTAADVLKFLLLTGARKGEALKATWDQFDLEKGVWTKPAHLTKQKKTEHLPLSTAAIDLLRTRKKQSSPKNHHVFPGRLPGQPLKDIKGFCDKVTIAAQIDNLRIHDLRHTHASHLVSSGLSLSIVGKLLGHTQASTTQRYAHLADDTLRDATAIFGDKVMGFERKKAER